MLNAPLRLQYDHTNDCKAQKSYASGPDSVRTKGPQNYSKVNGPSGGSPDIQEDCKPRSFVRTSNHLCLCIPDSASHPTFLNSRSL